MPISVPLTRGMTALVDDEDGPLAASRKWFAHKRRGYYYAAANVRVGGRVETVSLHRLIAGVKRGEMVDHRNGDTLDNRRSNLRLCTRGQNKQNAAKKKQGRSVYKGVFYLPKSNPGRPWVARITVDGRRKILGRFAREEDAAKAYDRAALNHFGEYARPNIQMPQAVAG